MPKKIYVLHKNGAPSHYYALEHLASKNGYKIAYREFSVFSKWYKGIIKGNWKLVNKQFTNAAFMLSLIFSKNKKVVLGIAPFDPKLKSLLRVLKGHQLYYHTSWTYWDGNFHPKKKKNTPKVMQAWKSFLENHCQHIFTVNEQGKSQLTHHYTIPKLAVSVVYHALHPDFENQLIKERKRNSFIYIGRLTPEKGIEELLDFFTSTSDATLTIIGDGKMAPEVASASKSHPNIVYKGYVAGKEALKKELASHQYLVLNSKKTEKWEELFGIIIIEAMSQGVLPVATTHSGPKEIIDESFGYLFEEGKITSTLAKLLTVSSFTGEKSNNAIKASKNYTIEALSDNWKAILQP